MPTGSHEKVKVYPDNVVKENLLANMPSRTRINRVPTHKQLQNSFENQVTMKRGFDDEVVGGAGGAAGGPHEQISILEHSVNNDSENAISDKQGMMVF